MMQRIFSLHMHLCHILILIQLCEDKNEQHKSSLISYFFVSGNHYCYHFVGHCGAFCRLKWRIWRAKMYFTPLK